MKSFLLLLIFISVLIGVAFLGNRNNNSRIYDDGGYYDSDYEEEYDPIMEITSDNWNCTDDCSGHRAGYDWAMNNSIGDPYDCEGNSESFIEGARPMQTKQDKRRNMLKTNSIVNIITTTLTNRDNI